MNENFDDSPHHMPTDFPNEPDYFGFLGWSLGACLFVAAIVAAIWRGYRTGYKGKLDDIFSRWPVALAKSVRKRYRKAFRARDEQISVPKMPEWFTAFFAIKDEPAPVRDNRLGEIDEVGLRKLATYIRSLLGYNLKLGGSVAVELKKLNEALEGLRTVEVSHGSIPAHMTGGTIINIAVNQGANGEGTQAVAGPYAGQGAPHGGPPQHIPVDRKTNIWLAYSKVGEDWDNPLVMAELLKAAQAQICTSPVGPAS